jgi:hypothetical protein
MSEPTRKIAREPVICPFCVVDLAECNCDLESLAAEVHRLRDALAAERAAREKAEGELTIAARHAVLQGEEIARLRHEFIAAVPKCSTDITDFQSARLAAQGWKIRADAAERALEAIIYASDQCRGHRDCGHSMEPWERARAILGGQPDGGR